MSPAATDLRGRRVLVVGLGRSGLAAARRLFAHGVRLTGTDLQPAEKLHREAQVLASAGVPLHCGGHLLEDFVNTELIVLSPGVPLDLPEIQAAREAGVPICSEIDLVAQVVGSRVVAITGSNGKTTTTALAGAMLQAAGREGVTCANIGTPFCEAVAGDHPGRWYAAELSSFQLEITHELQAAVGVLLNVQADHLDRHGNYEAYRSAKERIADAVLPAAPLVLAVDDPVVAAFARRTSHPVLEVSLSRDVREGGCLAGNRLVLRLGGTEETLAEVGAFALPGAHNRINVLCAAVACRAVGVPLDAMKRALGGFKSLPHRIQEIAQVNGVRYVDDSKATNVGSVLVALAAIRETIRPENRVFVLLGGRDKDSDFSPLAEALAAADAQPITFGEAGPKIHAVLAGLGCSGLTAAGTMEQAIETAASQASAGDVVLLSPACASFDAFTGYAARGDAFAASARRLAEEGR